MCTLHSFPHNIDHCLTFARSEFEGLLEKSPAEANAFLLDPVKCVSLAYALYQKGTLSRGKTETMCHASVLFRRAHGYAGI
jgi:Ubiquitin-activating enzyme active site